MSENEIKGILGTKLGMTQVFDEKNRVVPVTVIKAGPNVVTQIRTVERDGYSAVQIAFGAIDPRKVNKPVTGQFSKAGVTPRRHLAEIRVADVSEFEVGQELGADLFAFVQATWVIDMADRIDHAWGQLFALEPAGMPAGTAEPVDVRLHHAIEISRSG